jgi:DNA-binding MarR family transcriptional regulator
MKGVKVMPYVDDAIARIVQIHKKQKHSMTQRMEKGGQGEFLVLRILSDEENELTPKEIAQRTKLTSARVATILGSLEKKGQIVRSLDACDRRKIKVTMTATGRERVESEMSEMKRKFRYIFTELGPEKTKQMVDLTEEMTDLSLKYDEEMKESEEDSREDF